MPRLTARDVSFLELPTAVFCVECELISPNNTNRCLACGSTALLSLSRVLGGSMRQDSTAQIVSDERLNRVVDQILAGSEIMPADSRSSACQPAIAQESAMEMILEQASATTEAHGAALALWRGERMVCTAQIGIAPSLGAEVSPYHGISGLCLRTGQTLCCLDAERNALVDRPTCQQMGAQSIVVAPLTFMSHTMGILEVLSSRAYAFNDLHVATVQLMANVAVLAILQGSRRHLQTISRSSFGEQAF